MNIKDLSEFKKDDIASLLQRIPFFKALQQEDETQLATLMGYSCIVELDPGEIIMRRGDRGSWLYFLVKGDLSVFLDTSNDDKVINHITPGELFGDLALLCDHERKATVAAAKNGKKAILFATDFKPFGDVTDFVKVSLHTKLIFYRTMVHSIRWRLEQKRMARSDHPLAAQLRQVALFHGQKGTEAELMALSEQAKQLAGILDSWNNDLAG